MECLTILIPYHMYLVYLFITAKDKAEGPFSVARLIVVHPVCVGLMLHLGLGLGFRYRFWPVAAVVIAPLEVLCLFKKKAGKSEIGDAAPGVQVPVAPKVQPPVAPKVQPQAAPKVQPQAAPKVQSQAAAIERVDDHPEFLDYLHEKKRKFHKSGRSLREEQDLWRADRVKNKPAPGTSARDSWIDLTAHAMVPSERKPPIDE